MSGRGDITLLLVAWRDGDETARSRLAEAVYDELRRMAQRHLRRERAGHSLTPTALVHEAYLKLIDQRRVQWQNRMQFFAIAARVMRRVLVDHARARATLKRTAGLSIALDEVDVSATAMDVDVLALDVALQQLAMVDERQSQRVELRFFAGLSVDETATVLGVAPITVKRDWALARAWLFRALRGGRP